MSTKFTVDAANNFIANNKVVEKYYPEINFAAPIGWMNDPNGVSVYNNELHLFYQYFPYDSVHNSMHWGHAKTKDGLVWENLDVALAPDQPYDKDGVFSGSAIEKDGKLYLMYSGHVFDEEGVVTQNQNIAISEDGVTFEKYEHNPVIDGDDVPEGSSINDFRDPKVFEKNGKYYSIIGSKNDKNEGQVLLYESDNLLDWEYKSIILPYNEFLGDMVECPDLLLFEETDVFLLSAMNYTDKESNEYYPHISWLIEGKVNWDTFVFEVSSIRKMDGGFDYYAPQTALSSTNPIEYTAIAWHQAWNRTMPAHDEGHKWTGQMTIPRVLKEVDNKILQYPMDSILSKVNYIEELDNINIDQEEKYNLNEQYLEFSLENEEQVDLTFSNDENEKITIEFDAVNNNIHFSRKETINIVDSEGKEFNEIDYPLEGINGDWDIKIFKDTSSIQIFINDYYTLSSTYYANDPLVNTSFTSKNASSIKNVKFGLLTQKGSR